jgi:propanediol dehydratase large subunit
MTEIDESGDDDAVVIACIQEQDEFITMKLCRYPLDAVALAAGTHLEGLLGVLFDESQCTAEEVRELLRGIESGVLDLQRRA